MFRNFCLLLCIWGVAGSAYLQAHEEPFTMPADPIMVMETTAGVIELQLFPAVAPKAVENFIRLAAKGYYDGTIFHHVVRDFAIEGGDPTGTGKGGESIWGKPFEDEYDKHVTFNHAWRLGMKSKGSHNNGSQFFITTVPVPGLNGRQTLFGEVIHGREVVRHIEHAHHRDSHPGVPKHPESILKMYLKNAER